MLVHFIGLLGFIHRRRFSVSSHEAGRWFLVGILFLEDLLADFVADMVLAKPLIPWNGRQRHRTVPPDYALHPFCMFYL